MDKDEEKLRKELVLKEELLLENATRSNADRIRELIGGNCIEIIENGKQYAYKPGELFGDVSGVLYIDSNTISMMELSTACRLLLYTAARVNKNTRTKYACSSIWKNDEGTWKLVFHQRTACSE